ncbi:penicillin-binding protein [Patescibacteria group bacterium]|nr:MAG: penicillin-binding protein [Patescibacteria group bacterium]
MARRTHSRKKRIRSFLHYLKTVFLFFIGSAFLFASILILWASFMKLPDFAGFHERKIAQSTKIYDRTGEILLYDVHQNIKRTIVPFEEISPLVKKAVVAIEDTAFYEHMGISLRGIARAVLYGGTRGGGSTITQQVVKKTLLTDEKLITRKMKEIILSFRLEQAFTKDEILALYLNEIPYGGSIYGVGEASTAFFGKTPSDITLAQAAYLAAIPNAPTYFSPYGNHRDKLDERKELVLKRMYTLGFITSNEYAEAKIEKVEFLPREKYGIRAPHFVEWVKEYLVTKYGELAIEENGYRVITTLDYELQKKAEEIISSRGPDIEKNFQATNMALVAISPTSGQVLSMVGSRDYFNVEKEGNFNVALAHRQPGSTFKPFVYGTAFMKGYTPETTLFDLPTNFSTNCDSKGNPLSPGIKPEDCYMPENYDGKYRGPISMRDALAQSLNIPAVKTLYLAGITDSLTTARRMGIESLGGANQYGLTLVLGGGEVSLLDLTSAYGVFANDGVRNPTTRILRIEDKDGKIIEEYVQASEQVVPSEIARKITNILADNVARTPEFGANSTLYFPGKDVAVKTGTTNDFRDVWTVGYTPHIAVGMWAGNNDNTPLHKNIAGFIITPVWHDFMVEAMKLTPSERFIQPDTEDLTALPAPLQGIWKGGEKYIIDKASGKLATQSTPVEMKSVEVVSDVHNILHWINKSAPRGLPLLTPQNDPQYALWEIPVREWVLTQSINEGDRSSIPSDYDTSRTSESLPVISLFGTDFNTTHNIDDVITISVSVASKYPINRVEFFVNNELLEQKTSEPFSVSFIPNSLTSVFVNNIITVVVYDSILNKGIHTTQLQIEQW